jgi:hypothetical protein
MEKLPCGTLEKLSGNPTNWNGCYYSCKEDPRIIVPKRSRMGYTLNFAQSAAIPLLILIIIFMGGPLVYLAVHGYNHTWILPAALVFEIGILCAVCSWIASPKRYEQ